jgi:excisionase family DNA binding protein
MTPSPEPYLTPPEIAKLLRVSPEKVLGWIRRAELRAVNVGNGTRPRYRVSREWLDAFLQVREVQPPAPRQVRRKREQRPEGGPIDPVLGEQLLKKKQAVRVGKHYYRVWNGMTLYF